MLKSTAMMDALLSSAELKNILIALFVTVAGSLIIRFMQPKAKIVWSETHGFSFSVPILDPNEEGKFLPIPATYHTQTIFVQNTGRGPAKDVELIFNYKPEHFEFWPITPYKENLLQGTRYSIVIENMAPKEYFSVELLGTYELPKVLRVRSVVKEGIEIQTIPQQNFPRWVTWVVATLMACGAFLIIYLITKFLLATIAVWP